MRIVVTGGSGFLGSHLCTYLIDEGHEVFCIDNFYTSSRKNISHLENDKNFHMIIADITKPINLCSRVDQVYNLACPASPIHYQRDPIHTWKTSVFGAYNMLEFSRECGAKFLHTSTSEIYGDPKVHPQPESYWGNVNPVGCRSCYDSQTEILTNSGWKFFKDLDSNDLVATYENGFLKYYKPDEIIKQKYKGDMYHFHNVKYDLLVTPNHKMIRLTRCGKISRSNAEDKVDWKHSKFISGINNSDMLDINDINYFGIDLNCSVDNWLKFFGHYLADGCVYLRKYTKIVYNKIYYISNHRIILTHGGNQRKIDLYKKSFTDIGLKCHDLNDHQIMVTNKKLYYYLKNIGKALDKYIPNIYLKLSMRQSKILLMSMVDGDGTRKGKSFTYYTGSSSLKDDIQILILNSGMSSSFKFYNSHGGFKGSKGCFHIYGRNNTTPICIKPIIKCYDGFVYCVNVKNHIICVRRNGKVVFCGNCYDESKRAVETLIVDYNKQYGVDTRIVRVFNTFGPKMDKDDGRVVSNFIIQALKNEPITVYGDGSQTRSFQYVSDLINGIVKLMESSYNRPINIGSNYEHTVLELANIIINLTNSRSEIVYKELPLDDPLVRKPDISLAKKVLNWEPVVSLKEGLIRTIEYFKAEINENT